MGHTDNLSLYMAKRAIFVEPPAYVPGALAGALIGALYKYNRPDKGKEKERGKQALIGAFKGLLPGAGAGAALGHLVPIVPVPVPGGGTHRIPYDKSRYVQDFVVNDLAFPAISSLIESMPAVNGTGLPNSWTGAAGALGDLANTVTNVANNANTHLKPLAK